MSHVNLSGAPGFSRAVASVPVPVEQAVALLGAASGAGWVGTSGERTVVVTEDPADAAGVAAVASGIDRDETGLMIWTSVAPDGERRGGFAVTTGGIAVGHTWAEDQDDDAAVLEAQHIVTALGSDVEPYLLRALLRRTGDPEDLVVEALHLLGLDTRLHTILVEGPPEHFTYVDPVGGLEAWGSVLTTSKPRFWKRRRPSR